MNTRKCYRLFKKARKLINNKIIIIIIGEGKFLRCVVKWIIVKKFF